MLRTRVQAGLLQRLSVFSGAAREAVQPFDITLADQFGLSERAQLSRAQGTQARERMARAQQLLQSCGDEAEVRALAVTLSFVALAAKISVCDGPLNREEYLAFRAAFPLEGGVCRTVRRLFSQACADDSDAAHYAKLLAQFLPRISALRAEVLGMLVEVARADGAINPRETALLWQIAAELGFTPSQAQKLLLAYARAQRNPRSILKVSQAAPASRVRGAYLAAMKRLHPDKVSSQDLLPEGMAIAARKAAALNAAYDALTRK